MKSEQTSLAALSSSRSLVVRLLVGQFVKCEKVNLRVSTYKTVVTVVTEVTKQLCSPKNLTYLKPTYLCDSSYCRDSNDSSDSSDH